jgi:mono/diheme cytochrome c family protein
VGPAPAARLTRASGETFVIPARAAGGRSRAAARLRRAACHALRAAGAHGTVGPDLDRARPDAQRVVDVVTNGKGAMPPYKGRLTATQIRNLAAYVAQATR